MLYCFCSVCFIYCSIQSDDQEDISEDHDYDEIGSVSYHEVNLSDDMIETCNEQIAEEEMVSETIPISACSSSTGSNITMIHYYVNTNIFNTNEPLKMSVKTKTITNRLNESENGNMEIDDNFVNGSSESDTSQAHPYVNITRTRVTNVYEDFNHTTADKHKIV